jgi:3-isopropylmalate/(R)-2-methylmalate dehydratase small subunit
MRVNKDKIIRKIVGRGLPKTEPNQNTDDMVYGEFLNQVSFAKMAEYLFHKERFREDGAIVEDHPLNMPEYRGANILIGGENFGTGSSREHAPQAIKKWGFDAIIAPDYAGIFQGNCANVGLVAVTLPHDSLMNLAQDVCDNPSLELTVDLEDKTFSYTANKYQYNGEIDIDEPIRQAFLTGTWDPLDELQENADKVREKLESLPYAGVELNNGLVL